MSRQAPAPSRSQLSIFTHYKAHFHVLRHFEIFCDVPKIPLKTKELQSLQSATAHALVTVIPHEHATGDLLGCLCEGEEVTADVLECWLFPQQKDRSHHSTGNDPATALASPKFPSPSGGTQATQQGWHWFTWVPSSEDEDQFGGFIQRLIK